VAKKTTIDPANNKEHKMTYFARTKTNRLTKPKLKQISHEQWTANDKLNWCGQPHAQPGDFVYLSGRPINAGTVGRIVDVDADYIKNMTAQGHSVGDHFSSGTPAKIEFLDGNQHRTWLWYLTVIDAAALQEVKDFYITDGRPERIKVTW
jgi:hypothetical protein